MRSLQNPEFLEGLARLHPFVLVANADGTIEWMNERLRARFEDESLPAFVPRREQLAALRDGLDTPATSGVVHLEVETQDGTQVCVDATAVQMTVDPGAPSDPRCVVIARPQGEHNENARALEGTISLLSQILESSPSGVIATDRSGYITYVNPQAEAFAGLKCRDLVGRPAAFLLAQIRGAAELVKELGKPAGSERSSEFEIIGTDRNLWISARTRKLQDDRGRDCGFVTYLQDITEHHLVKEELERKNSELESYVDSVAHDLRSPLVSLLGFTRLLREDYETSLDDAGHRFLDRIEEAGRTMDGLIRDLLELSRIRTPGDFRPVLDPRSVLQQLATELKLRLDQQGIELLLPADPPIMQVDETRLYQVLSNLVGNAVKHGFGQPDQHAAPRISIDIHEIDGGHEIVVSDNGQGVPEEDHERIFETFQTGRHVRRADHSHGIGLAIVKKIAQAHGGRVWIESKPGQGAHFHVLFPAPQA
ncbi:MAG: PAS domain-containing sensor histidine kinase [Myxococcota bacterium]